MQHFPKDTLKTMVFCNVCNKKTMHRVDQGRVGCCLEPHSFGLSEKKKKTEKKRNQQDLFK